MSDYTPPLEDMQFLLDHVIGLDKLPDHPDLGKIDSEMVDSILQPAAKLARDVIAPLNQPADQKGAKLEKDGVRTAKGFKEAYVQYRDGGWNAVPFSAEHGGQNLPWLVALPLQEMWQSACMSFGLCPLLNQSVVEGIEAHGSEDQKNEYLEKLISGEWTGTMNLTEPQSGSDLSEIRTKAEPQDDGSYKITGQKIFISYGDHDLADNIIHLVLARTPDAPEGVKGISLFIVPKFLEDGTRNDVKPTGIEHKMGLHASPTCTMQYGDKDGATGYLVGAENEGLKYMFTTMNNARIAVGLQGIAVAERAYQQALTYAKERVQGTTLTNKKEKVAIIEHPDVKRMLFSMKSQIEALRALTYEAALNLDLAAQGDKEAQARVDLLTPIVKAGATDMAIDVTSTGIQVHGGMGFIEETGAAQHFRDSRILSIYEGTNGIQALDLAFRKTIRDQGSTVRAYLSEIGGLLNDLDQIADPRVLDIRHALDSALDHLTAATNWMIDQSTKDIDAPAASAKPYLEAFALVAGGAMMAKSVLAAKQQLDYGQGDEAFLEDKITTAQFYATHILPKAESHARTVQKGADPVLKANF
ncbi:MAG: acyl-CoA dehydrogenase [Alphaproteobacteria bacterium]|nr:acyl-CoA dehydrogenase [Alphaproteobacteria bacterium]